MPNHLIVRHVTEGRLQSVIAWALGVWLQGKFPRLDDLGNPWGPRSTRAKLAAADTVIAGGHVAVYTGTVCDHAWKLQHYRYSSVSGKHAVCHECCADDAPGPLNFLRFTECVPRFHDFYMRSQAAQDSPLSAVPGFHITMTRAEAMHCGPLGAMMDAVGSACIELCEENCWGCSELSPWKFRLGTQLSAAHMDFCNWAKHAGHQHTVKKCTVAGFSMETLSGSWPCYKGKAHNCLALCRWLAAKVREHSRSDGYAQLRAQVMWSWAEIFEVIGNSEDPDWLNTAELKRLDDATNLLLHGTKVLGRPKLHSMWHVNHTAQLGHRNPRAYWSFKDEEMMGKLGAIAAAAHAQTVPARSLEHWCMQFFNAMSPA